MFDGDDAAAFYINMTPISSSPTEAAPAEKNQSRSLSRFTLGGMEEEVLLLPSLVLAALLVSMCGWVSLRLALAPLLTVIWLASPLLIVAFIGIRGWRRPRGAEVLLFGLAAATVWVVLADVAGRLNPAGLVSYHPDAWSYRSMADYFLHYSRSRSGTGLPMIDQFGSTLRQTRFGSAVMLALLARGPWAGEVGGSPTAFYVICVGVHFFSLCSFARALGTPWVVSLGAAVLGTAGGWLNAAITVGNYDSLLFIALAPAWLGLVARQARGAICPAHFVLAGALLLGAILEVYPEGFALLGVLALPLFVQVLRKSLRETAGLVTVFGMGIGGVLLAAPYLPIFVSFLQHQITVGTKVGPVLRAGAGNFPGLLNSHWFPAVFALGEELPGTSFGPVNCLLPAALCVCIVAGAITLRRDNRWFSWTALCLLALSLWQGVETRYDYGFYKVLLCATWWIYTAAAAGLWRLLQMVDARLPVRPAIVVLFAAAIAAEKWEDASFRVWQGNDSLQSLSELTEVDKIIGSAPVLIDLHDDFEFNWATLYLRTHPLGSIQLRSYYAMPHVRLIRLIAPEDCQYTLVSGARPDAIWQNDAYSLMPNRGAQLLNLANAQGVETLHRRPFFWLGHHGAELSIYAMQSGGYDLCSTALLFGPSFPQNSVSRRVEVTDAKGTHESVVPAPGLTALMPTIPIDLERGLNRVTLRDLDPVTAPPKPDDPRELLLGVEGIHLYGPKPPPVQSPAQ